MKELLKKILWLFPWFGNVVYRKELRILHNSRYFDEKYYYFLRPDVFNAKRDAALHYLFYGWKEGVNPSEYFNTVEYLRAYPDINFNPLLHYELFGKNERRTIGIKPILSIHFINKTTNDIVNTQLNASSKKIADDIARGFNDINSKLKVTNNKIDVIDTRLTKNLSKVESLQNVEKLQMQSLQGRLDALQTEVNNHRRQTTEIQLVVQEERALRQKYATTIDELKKQIDNITNLLNSKQNNFDSKLAKNSLEQEKKFVNLQKQELEKTVTREENILKIQKKLFDVEKQFSEQSKQLIGNNNNENEILKNLIERNKKDILQQVEHKINAIPEVRCRNVNHINKEVLASKIENFEKLGINNENERDKKIIVNLTSFPERMYDIHYCLYSLLNQSCKPDMVILWLAEEEFPEKEKNIPARVLKLQENGLTIKWCKNNYSYKKLIQALKDFPDEILVTADDDLFYPENWLAQLYDSYLKNPDFIHCHRAHRVKLENNKITPYSVWEKCINDVFPSYLNFFTSGGGTLSTSKHFYRDITEEKIFQSLSPNSDDIWFWAMAVLNNTKINVVKNPVNNITYINPEREFNFNGGKTLYSTNKTGNNDKQLSAVLEYYPEILEKLFKC